VLPVTQSEILNALALLEVQAVTCGKVRVGGANDGGYVMADAFRLSTVAYSIGVGPQVIWDADMADRGMTIHQYDHTVPGLPQQHSNFRFNPVGIGTDLTDPQLITLEEMLRRNGHLEQTNMLLKIDVEGAEWDVFDALSHHLLARFDQIVVEFHGLEYLGVRTFLDRAVRVFRTLTSYHEAIHIHANNYSEIAIIEGVPVPGVVEVTYALRNRFTFLPSHEMFPTALDQPCRPDRPDIFLGPFRFRR